MTKSVKNFLWYILGSALYSAAVVVFISPNEISPGGITGIATLLNYLFGLPTGIMLFAFNIPILILGYRKFGGKFIFSTSLVTALISVIITVFEETLSGFVTDKILASVFGGSLLGFGISLIMLHGSTTGGLDIIAKVINSRYRHLTVGKIILALDCIIIALAVAVYGNAESALYSVISMFASSMVMDYLLYGGDKGKVVYVISAEAKVISRAVSENLARGSTILEVKGGYTGENRQMLMCTVRAHEVAALYGIIERFDANAFIFVTEAGEIIGEGFKGFH